MLERDEQYLHFLKQDYLREKKLLDKIEDYLINEVKVDRSLLECMIGYNGKDFKVLRHIYEYTTGNEDFNEIVEQFNSMR